MGRNFLSLSVWLSLRIDDKWNKKWRNYTRKNTIYLSAETGAAATVVEDQENYLK